MVIKATPKSNSTRGRLANTCSVHCANAIILLQLAAAPHLLHVALAGSIEVPVP